MALEPDGGELSLRKSLGLGGLVHELSSVSFSIELGEFPERPYEPSMDGPCF